MTGTRSLIDLYPLGSYVDGAAKRNRDPILEVFKQLFPPSGDILELASGRGVHINYFAPHFPHVRFQPSDYDKGVFAAIRQMQADSANANVWDPIHIDLTRRESWPDDEVASLRCHLCHQCVARRAPRSHRWRDANRHARSQEYWISGDLWAVQCRWKIHDAVQRGL